MSPRTSPRPRYARSRRHSWSPRRFDPLPYPAAVDVRRPLALAWDLGSGGEAAALVLVEAVTRLVPGVVGNEESLGPESFEGGLLDHPHYTRPRVYRGLEVPEALLSGDHARIAEWRREAAVEKTRRNRPDLAGPSGQP